MPVAFLSVQDAFARFNQLEFQPSYHPEGTAVAYAKRWASVWQSAVCRESKFVSDRRAPIACACACVLGQRESSCLCLTGKQAIHHEHEQAMNTVTCRSADSNHRGLAR